MSPTQAKSGLVWATNSNFWNQPKVSLGAGGVFEDLLFQRGGRVETPFFAEAVKEAQFERCVFAEADFVEVE